MLAISLPTIDTGPFSFHPGAGPSSAANLSLPPLFPWQEQVVAEARRFNVVCVGRRAGKTALALNRCTAVDVQRYPVGWFSPSYKMMTEVWREAENALLPIIKRKSTQERRIELTTGGVLEFWSLDNPLAGRSRKYKRVVIDEAAFVSDLGYAWNNVIRPTLADLRGDAWLMSTPKGHNGFWQLWQRGQDEAQGDWRSWQMPSEVNPLIPPEELAEIRASYPERVIAQEYDAMFLDDAGGVFRGVMTAATAEPQASAHHGHEYILGVDWARSVDYTCIAVLDVTTSELVALDRFNQIDYTTQVGRLTALAERFRPTAIVAEANSIGTPLIEQLRLEGLPVVPFTTTNATKQVIVDALALAFERGAIRILPDPVLIAELQAYEAGRLPSGLLRYGAPDGMHDDTVMALMLAWHRPTPAVATVTSYVQTNYTRRR